MGMRLVIGVKAKAREIMKSLYHPVWSILYPALNFIDLVRYMIYDKQRNLVSKMKFEIFFLDAQDPFHNYTDFLKVLLPSQNSIFGITTPRYIYAYLRR